MKAACSLLVHYTYSSTPTPSLISPSNFLPSQILTLKSLVKKQTITQYSSHRKTITELLIDQMAIIKVHGSAISTNATRVIACLTEKGLDFDFVPVDMASGAHKKQPHLSLNPFGQVPAFEDGDLKLFESRAINEYIARAYPNHGTELIYHEDVKKNALVTVWSSVEAHQFNTPASKLTWELVGKPMMGRGVADEAVVEELEAQLAKVLDVYEARLAESKYLGGDKFTLADLNHLPVMGYLIGTRAGKLFDSRPHVSAWSADIRARPAWLKIQATKNRI